MQLFLMNILINEVFYNKYSGFQYHRLWLTLHVQCFQASGNGVLASPSYAGLGLALPTLEYSRKDSSRLLSLRPKKPYSVCLAFLKYISWGKLSPKKKSYNDETLIPS